MNEERLRILKLLEDKKINSAEAMSLLEALEKGEKADEAQGGRRARVLKIRVYEEGSPEPKVNVNVPLGWSRFMAPFIEGKIKEKLAAKGYNVDLGKLQEAIESAEPMKIVDVKDGGDKVEISIE